MNIQNFQKNGYVNIGKILNEEEISLFKSTILEKLTSSNSEKKNSFTSSKNLTLENKIFYKLLVNPKILSTVKILCKNKTIMFTPHTDTHINLGAGKIHRDNSDRVYGFGSDWNEIKDQYNVFRIAVYLTSYKEAKTSLILFPGTHKKENLYKNLWFRFFNKTVRGIKKIFPSYQVYQFSPFIKKEIIEVNAGDCIIFDKRVLHAGGKISNKTNSNKISIFFSYGEANNIHTLNDINTLKLRGYMTSYPQDLKTLFKQNDIVF